MPPFTDYKAYGPYMDSTGGRNIIALRNHSRGHTSVSFARFLLSVHLGRVLGPTEEVDHINGNRTDDRLENLQVVSSSQNLSKSLRERSVSRKEVRLRCPGCQQEFQKRKSATHLAKGGRFTSCSRECRADILRKQASIATKAEIERQISANVIEIVDVLSG